MRIIYFSFVLLIYGEQIAGGVGLQFSSLYVVENEKLLLLYVQMLINTTKVESKIASIEG